MKLTKITKTIYHIERLNNSYYGNPRYLIIFDDFTQAKTASNASIGYEITTSMEDNTYSFKAHLTPSGNIILDYLIK